jgi:response regulator RpfG family c-di-GMP phosphodiesterase
MVKKAAAPAPLTSKPQVAPVATAKTAKKVVASKLKAKPVAKPIVKPVAEAVVKAAVEKVVKVKKLKQMRDSFTIPKTEYVVLNELKERSASLTHAVKKSELLRAGIKALAAMTDANFLSALKAVPAIKTGRPKK